MSKAQKEPSPRDLEILDVREAMQSPAMRRVMRRILGWCGMYHSGFRDAGPLVRPEERLVANAAKRDLGQQLMNELTKCAPVEYDAMELEARLAAALEKPNERQPVKANESESED